MASRIVRYVELQSPKKYDSTEEKKEKKEAYNISDSLFKSFDDDDYYYVFLYWTGMKQNQIENEINTLVI